MDRMRRASLRSCEQLSVWRELCVLGDLIRFALIDVVGVRVGREALCDDGLGVLGGVSQQFAKLASKRSRSVLLYCSLESFVTLGGHSPRHHKCWWVYRRLRWRAHLGCNLSLSRCIGLRSELSG